MAQYVDRLEVPLLVGVGAAFDYHTGRIRDCPDWAKKAGLQWLHRILQDPTRLLETVSSQQSCFRVEHRIADPEVAPVSS